MIENILEHGVIKGLKPPFILMKTNEMSSEVLFNKALKDTMAYYKEGVKQDLITEEEAKELFDKKCVRYIEMFNIESK